MWHEASPEVSRTGLGQRDASARAQFLLFIHTDERHFYSVRDTL